MVERSSLFTSGRALRSLLALCLLTPLLTTVLWGDVYADTAYEGFRQARAIATGQGWDLGGSSPLYTLFLALASYLRLPLPSVAMTLSAVGWMIGVAAWFLTGLALDRPTFSAAAAILLGLHPWQGRALGLETGLVLGLLGLAAWLVVQDRAKAAIATSLVLAAVQPLAPSLVLPLLIRACLRNFSAPAQSEGSSQTHRSLVIDHRSLSSVAFSVAVGAVCYTLACILSDLWDEPRWTVPLLVALDILAAAGFALLVPDFDWLVAPAADKRALERGFLAFGLVALAFWQGSVLVQDWRFRPTNRLALYETLGRWISDHTLPTETVAAQQAGLLGYLSCRPTVPLSDTSRPFVLVAEIDSGRPDYCVALNNLVWYGVRAQPWFQEHYEEIHRLASPYDATTPLTLFRYTPTPFDDGGIISTTASFAFEPIAGGQIELTGYRLGSHRITPGEPLYLTLFWHTATPIRQPLLLIVRLVDPATGQVWTKVENTAPGGLTTDLWNGGTRLDDRYTLMPPADIPPGDYVLDVALYLPSGRPLPVRVSDRRAGPPSIPPIGGEGKGGETRLVLAQASRPPNVSTVPLAPDHPLSVTFGSEVQLVGYDVIGRVAPGDTLCVALYWYTLQPVPLDYKVFVHLLGPALSLSKGSGDQQLLIAQDDNEPVGWTYPTTRWQPGETIRDEHALAIPPSAPRGDYWLVVGLYDPATGGRPSVHDAAGSDVADRCVMLQQIHVR